MGKEIKLNFKMLKEEKNIREKYEILIWGRWHTLHRSAYELLRLVGDIHIYLSFIVYLL